MSTVNPSTGLQIRNTLSITNINSSYASSCFQRPRPRGHVHLDQRPADHQVHVGRVQAGPPAVLFSHRQLAILHDPRGLRHVGSGEPQAGGGVLHLDVARRHRVGHALASWSSIILFPQYGISQYESSLFVGTNAASSCVEKRARSALLMCKELRPQTTTAIGKNGVWLAAVRVLAVKGKSLGRKALMELTTIVTPDTILRWHRKSRGKIARCASSLRPTDRSCLRAPTENGLSFPQETSRFAERNARRNILALRPEHRTRPAIPLRAEVVVRVSFPPGCQRSNRFAQCFESAQRTFRP